MAGLLSKGITLACRGLTYYRHTVDFDGTEIVVVNGNPNSITGEPKDNIGAITGGTYNGSIVLGGEYDAAGDVVKIYYQGGVIDMINPVGTITDSVTRISGSDSFEQLTDLQEIPELGNNSPERIDVTVLSDGAKKSIAGLADTAQDLAFKFLYKKAQFETLAAMEGSHEWRVTLPDGTIATFFATPSVKLAGVGVSAALTYTLSLSVESEIVFA